MNESTNLDLSTVLELYYYISFYYTGAHDKL